MIEGLNLTAAGLVTVFAFLGLLVVAMRLTAVLVARLAPDPPAPEPKKQLGADTDHLLAIAVAVAARERATHAGTSP